MQEDFYYEIGKNGSYDDICKHYIYDAEKDILKGLKDRNSEELLIKLHRKFNFSIYNVCEIGIRPLVDCILKNNTLELYILNYGLENACRGGHRDIVNLLIQKGANHWNLGLRSACRGGNNDLVDLMIEKGANDWNYGLWNACHGGHRDLVDLMIQKGANDWNYGLRGACYGGHLDLVKYMIEKGANKYHNYEGFSAALNINYWTIIEYLLIIGVTDDVPGRDTDYYIYLSRKLIRTEGNNKSSIHGLYYELNYLVSLY